MWDHKASNSYFGKRSHYAEYYSTVSHRRHRNNVHTKCRVGRNTRFLAKSTTKLFNFRFNFCSFAGSGTRPLAARCFADTSSNINNWTPPKYIHYSLEKLRKNFWQKKYAKTPRNESKMAYRPIVNTSPDEIIDTENPDNFVPLANPALGTTSDGELIVPSKYVRFHTQHYRNVKQTVSYKVHLSPMTQLARCLWTHCRQLPFHFPRLFPILFPTFGWIRYSEHKLSVLISATGC